ncbi:hypothetical protein LTR16_000950 [Cryomyces antarcticus]|uniref:chitinase n=2 Tax=Cryomyces antarcticus TaxID=329879 RepID=A0ABR0LQK9_9PEZI|nr:hypothetical protein LTR60_000447 [Cryomyces antarcticus]KAK5201933.1 hypothetical protein LTR16_000950 [Cryomyces antarcticus]
MATPTAVAVAGDGLLQDIQGIQQGFEDLPRDLLDFLTSLEQRMQQVEAALQGLFEGNSTLAQPSTESMLEPVTSTNLYAAATTSDSTAGTSEPSFYAEAIPTSISAEAALSTSESEVVTYTSTYLRTSTVHGAYPSAISTLSIASLGPYPPHYTNYSKPAILNATASAIPTDQGDLSPSFLIPYIVPSGSASTPTAPVISASGSTSPPASTPSSSYTFDAEAADNVAVYYGVTPVTTAGGLLTLCENPNIDIVNLAFLMTFFGPSSYPTINLGPGCTGSTSAQQASAPGLMNCTTLAPEIAACQQIGKKVLVSLGGAVASTSFVSDDQATEFAATLWSLFGTGTIENPDLRPFGPGVVVDGFDIDNENHDTSHYEVFAAALRAQFATDPTKPYYLSAAPQCPRPDASIPLGAMRHADFIWVQFFNNLVCDLSGAGFVDAFAAWSADLSNGTAGSGHTTNYTTPLGVPRLFVGAGAWPGAGSGYVEGAGLATVVSGARELNTGMLGGMMLWDGSEALANVDRYGVDYLEYAKSSLQ